MKPMKKRICVILALILVCLLVAAPLYAGADAGNFASGGGGGGGGGSSSSGGSDRGGSGSGGGSHNLSGSEPLMVLLYI